MAIVNMETLFLSEQNIDDIEKAGQILKNGGLVVIPTETVYGLAANALDKDAVKKIYTAKGRPSDNPLIVHISDLSQLSPLVREIPQSALKLAEAYWPGPLTMILPKSDLIPEETSGGLDTVAVRFPSHPTAQAVITAAGCPLAAPSANRSGRPSPTTFAHVREDMDGRVDALLDGGDCSVGVESTVVTLAEGTPRLLRPGGITVQQLRAVLGEVTVDSAVLHRLAEGTHAASPGMKYKHYAPKADVTIVDASPSEFVNYVNSKEDCCALCFDEDVEKLRVPAVSYGTRYDGQKQAHMLFSALHYLDEIEAETVYARIPSRTGVGLAVYNRLLRAAGFSVINPEKRCIVGLTGQSGAGKTTVGKILSGLGCAVIDCDALTRDPEVYNVQCLMDLQNAFGNDIVLGGELKRGLLAKRAFATPESRKKLNSITHPRILNRLWDLIHAEQEKGKRVIVLDAPTLFEAGLDRDCARILAVTAPEDLRLERILERDGISEAQALLRVSAQHTENFYTGRADYVVVNDGNADLEKTLIPIVRDLNGET